MPLPVVNPVVTFGASGGFAALGGILAQLDQQVTAAGTDWSQTGALGLLGTSSVLLVIGVLRGDILHTKSAEREKALEELVRSATALAEAAHSREVVHERFMTAAIDRIVDREQDR